MNSAHKLKVGVVGVGMVGGQVLRWFKSRKHSVVAYDKYKKIGSPEDIATAKIIFLCLPTPHRKNQKSGTDIEIFNEIIKSFKESKIFVIKSTIPPGVTGQLQKKFKKHYFLHSPEFLTEATAWKDFSKPDLQLIGYTKKSKKFATLILKILPKAKFSLAVSATTTEIFKLARNAFFSVKVTFANEIYDICQALGISYEEMIKMMSAEKWIGGNHLIVGHKGYRGFGGKCLPKDLKTFIKVYKKSGLDPELFKSVDRVNTGHIKRQGLIKTLNSVWLENHS